MTGLTSKHAGVRLVAKVMGPKNTLAVPVPFVKLLGDYASAAFLSQCLYWSDRTSDPDGWFYKTAAEWQTELHLTPDQVRRCQRVCGDYLEIVTGGKDNRTNYRIEWEALGEDLMAMGSQESGSGKTPNRFGQNPRPVPAKPQSGSGKNPNPINKEAKTTAETTAERGRPAAAVRGRSERPSGRQAGTQEANADQSQDQEQSQAGQQDDATSNGNVPGGAAAALRPGEVALRSAMGHKLFDECLAEDPDRAAWGDLSTERIGEIRADAKAEARKKGVEKWRTPFIALLDKAIVAPAPEARTNKPSSAAVAADVRARLRGNRK
ncbi:hypothetical protein [Deinococcus sp. Leaf326]|uniref:hypothetical protein n=1 Tax=Deinococcus sp. Leaf326 TaxID=1736338 RepID=UPI0006F7FE5A|nr:hypothetical protein [Deinococcus sp. Leaf326]KQR40789.1 hypothetical protein ASF71_01065 [Deinococcus sp. Leaf326]